MKKLEKDKNGETKVGIMIESILDYLKSFKDMTKKDITHICEAVTRRFPKEYEK